MTSTFDLSAATGTNVINTIGSAAGTMTTITLASEGGSDSIQVDDDNASIVIKNFQTGSGGDVLDIDDSGMGVLIQGAAGTPASGSRDIEELSAGETLDADDDL